MGGRYQCLFVVSNSPLAADQVDDGEAVGRRPTAGEVGGVPSPGPERSQRAMAAILDMRKIDIETLERAAAGVLS